MLCNTNTYADALPNTQNVSASKKRRIINLSNMTKTAFVSIECDK
jgi:hypothetical protein